MLNLIYEGGFTMPFVKSKAKLFLIAILVLGLVGTASAQDLIMEMQANPLITGNYTNSFADDGYLFVTTGNGLAIFDVSLPATPVMISEIATAGISTGLYYDFEQYVYVADGYNGLVVIDVSDMANPFVAAQIGLGGRARDIFPDPANARIFIAMEEAGVAIVDITDPLNPSLEDTYTTDIDRAAGLAYADDILYIGDLIQLQSVNVSTYPSTQISLYPNTTGDNYLGLWLTGNVLYATNGNDGMDEFTVSAGYFTFVTTHTLPGYCQFISGLANGNLAIAARGTGINLFDPVAGSNFPIPTTAPAQGCCTFDNTIYAGVSYAGVAPGVTGFDIITTSVIGGYYIEGGPRNIFVMGDIAYIADYDAGLKTFDVSDPRNPVELGTGAIEDDWAYDVAVVGDYAFVVAFFSGLHVFDVSTPANPIEVGTYPVTQQGSRACALYTNNYLIMVHYDLGIAKFDITNPMNPGLVGTWVATTGEPRDVVVDETEGFAFVADYGETTDDGVDVWDISGVPTAPIDQYPIENCRSVAVLADYLYAGGNDGILHFFSVSGAGMLTHLNQYQTVNDIHGLAVDNLYYVYAANWEKGMEVVYAIDPANPEQAAYVETQGFGKAACYHDNFIYIADSYSFYIYALGGAVEVTLPDIEAAAGSALVIPVTVTETTGLNILSANMTITYDLEILNIDTFDAAGTMMEIANWIITPNLTPGSAILGGWASPPTFVPLTGSGTLINFTGMVDAGAAVGETTDLTFTYFIFGEGRPVAYTYNGSVTVIAQYTISGTVTYYDPANPNAVPDVDVDLSGFAVLSYTTGGDGYYEFTDLGPGYYEVDLHKMGGVNNAVDFSDAVYAAQAAVGLITFTPHQTIAGDVYGGTGMTFDDAVYIAQFSVGLITQFQQAAAHQSDWAFDPWGMEYDPLSGDEIQDYTAILYGDCYTSWSPTVVASAVTETKNNLLSVEKESYSEGDIIYVNVHFAGDQPVDGVDNCFLQFEMSYNPSQVSFEAAHLTDLTQNWTQVINNNEPGLIKGGAFYTQQVTLDHTGDIMMRLEFKAKKAIKEIPVSLTSYQTTNSNVYQASFPETYYLAQNHPNPFNAGTVIRYYVPIEGNVTLDVYNSLGQKVRSLVNSVQTGYQEKVFNGRDDNGVDLASGIYFYQIRVNNYRQTMKMVLVR